MAPELLLRCYSDAWAGEKSFATTANRPGAIAGRAPCKALQDQKIGRWPIC